MRVKQVRSIQLSTEIWTSRLAIKLMEQGRQDALLVYLHMSSCQWSHCSGLQPIQYSRLAAELHFSPEQIFNCVELLGDLDAVSYDITAEWIWVHHQSVMQFALTPLKSAISANDLRCRSVMAQWEKCASIPLRALYCLHYGEALHVGPQLPGYEGLSDGQIRDKHREILVGPVESDFAIGAL